jgi:hypothetical protein
MKDLVRKVKSFLTFDFPLQTASIALQFADTHRKSAMNIPGWCATSTRFKLISDYWFHRVVAHFAAVFSIPALMVLLFTSADWNDAASKVPGIMLAGLMIYAVLYFFHYRPVYSSVFLPCLEAVKESFEQKQAQQMEKCRQAQLSNFALTLIFYVFDKIYHFNILQCDDKSAKLMAKLYGVDDGSLKKNLAVIVGKTKPLTLRKATEIRNQFEEAFTFLQAINCAEGIALLQKTESRLLSEKSPSKAA